MCVEPPRAVIPSHGGRAATPHALPVLGGLTPGDMEAQRSLGALFHRAAASPRDMLRAMRTRTRFFLLHSSPGNRGLCNWHEGDE